MMIYVGNTGTKEQIRLIKNLGYGRLHTANQWRNPEEGIPRVLDNGAFSYWKNELPFDGKRFEDAIIKTEASGLMPDFVIVPDIVAGGNKSLDFSLKWLNKIPAAYSCFLAVQDGMDVSVIQDNLNIFDGLFVGGSLGWKLKTAPEWVKLAHSVNKPCHIGRVGTFRRLVWARSIGADSVDSSTFAQAKPGRGYQRIGAAMSQRFLGDADDY